MKKMDIVFDVNSKKSISISLDEIIKSRALFQANSGGGKSYLLRKFLEESHGLVQQIIIDPEGEFATLRELPDNDYLLVAKDSSADIQLDSRHAPLLAKKLMETNANAIIDLYEINPFERIKYVKIFVDALVNLPKSLWHPCLVIIDEIHTFAPESSKGRSESLESVASLASRGRKRGYALIGATQKLSKFHKDVAAELNTKFTGRCVLDIDQKRAAAELGMSDYRSLRNLDHEFWAFGPAISGEPIKVKSYHVKTTHEDIGSTNNYTIANQDKIKQLRKNFQDLPQEAESELRTILDYQNKIQEFKTKITSLERQQPKQDPQTLESAFQRGRGCALAEAQRHLIQIKHDAQKYIQYLEDTISTVTNNLDSIHSKLHTLPKLPIPSFDLKLPILTDNSPLTAARKIINASQTDSQTKLGRCEESILKSLIQRGKKSSKLQIAVLAGYSSTSGGFNNAISKLKNLQFISSDNGDFEITQDGINHIGYFEPIPDDHGSILNFWTKKLGKCPASILNYICNNSKDSWHTKENIAEATGYSVNSGGFNNGLSQVCSLKLVKRNNGLFRATEEMFP